MDRTSRTPWFAVVAAALAITGCAGPAEGTDDEAPAGGKADGSTRPYSSERDLQATFSSKILPDFIARAEFGELIGVGGRAIRYVVLPAENERAAIVVFPGRTESFYKYAEVAWDLRGRGYSLYILDHRGQGSSSRLLVDREKGHVDAFGSYVADAKQFVDKVVRARPHRKLLALAHSMGGAIAAQYLRSYPNDFAAAVLSAPMFELVTPWYSGGELGALAVVTSAVTLGFGDSYAASQGPFDPLAPNDVSHSTARFQMSRWLFSEFPETILGGTTNLWVRESISAGRDLRSRAAEIRTPILLLEAGADQIVALEGGETFCAAAPRCEAARFAGSGHELLMERDAIRNAVLDKLLAYFQAASR